MSAFQLDPEVLQHELRRARAVAESGEVASLMARARSGSGLSPQETAALWYSAADTELLHEAAREMRARRAAPLETFSPLYMTNTCDAECRMCGMRRDNRLLVRETVDLDAVERQLETLSRRGMHAVALLTGEYRSDRRSWALPYVNRALRATQELGFAHVLVNVGSIDAGEFDQLLEGVARNPDGSIHPKLTMCTFQETYSRDSYAKFMGTDPENPRADFDRRLRNFDRAFAAGMRVANPGVLLGLHADLGYELFALGTHIAHLLGLGMEVYVSVPRLRRTAGGRTRRDVSDAAFVRFVALLALGFPAGKIVITTREGAAMQRKLAPIVQVLSSGSSAVAPYTETGARFPLEASQFEVIDQRPFEAILEEHLARGPIANYEPPATSRHAEAV